MADETPKTVTVEALQLHSYNGKDYQVGDTYEIDALFADSVAIQGKAVRTDRVHVAKQARQAEATHVAAKAKALRTPVVVTPKAKRAVKPAVKRAGKHRR